MQIRSDDPFDNPLINAGYLTDAGGEDLTTLRSAHTEQGLHCLQLVLQA